MDDILVDVGRTGKLTFTGIFHDPETESLQGFVVQVYQERLFITRIILHR